jgi:dethiobiotin synthetase
MTLPQPGPGVVLVGTDTGVGKTTFACALLRVMARAGGAPVPYKPSETGWDEQTSDASRLLRATDRLDLTLGEVCPFSFGPPVAPAAAAAAAGKILTADLLVPPGRALAHRGDFLLVETAGGLLSPYGPGTTSADLAAAFALPVVLVARNGLGTINHTALAIQEIRRRHLPLTALVLVDTSAEATPDRLHNAALISEHTGIRPLFTLPFVSPPDPDALADALTACIDRPELLARIAGAAT